MVSGWFLDLILSFFFLFHSIHPLYSHNFYSRINCSWIFSLVKFSSVCNIYVHTITFYYDIFFLFSSCSPKHRHNSNGKWKDDGGSEFSVSKYNKAKLKFHPLKINGKNLKNHRIKCTHKWKYMWKRENILKPSNVQLIFLLHAAKRETIPETNENRMWTQYGSKGIINGTLFFYRSNAKSSFSLAIESH